MQRFVIQLFLTLALAAVILCQSLAAQTESKKPLSELHKDVKVVSYIIGSDLGGQIRKRSQVDLDDFMEGFKLSFRGQRLKCTPEDANRLLSKRNKSFDKRLDEMFLDISLDGWLAVLADRSEGIIQGTLESKSEMQLISYLLGGNVGYNMRRYNMELEVPDFSEGLSDSFNSKPLKFSEQERQQIYRQMSIARQRERQIEALMGVHGIETRAEWDQIARKNEGITSNFLATNLRRPNIEVTKSGLQYEILHEGEGEHPPQGSRIKINVQVGLVDGFGFDIEDANSKKTTVYLGAEIAGFNEAFALMKPGSKWRLFIPPELAYGETGYAPPYEPNVCLEAIVELKEILPNPQAAGQISNVIEINIGPR